VHGSLRSLPGLPGFALDEVELLQFAGARLFEVVDRLPAPCAPELVEVARHSRLRDAQRAGDRLLRASLQVQIGRFRTALRHIEVRLFRRFHRCWFLSLRSNFKRSVAAASACPRNAPKAPPISRMRAIDATEAALWASAHRHNANSVGANKPAFGRMQPSGAKRALCVLGASVFQIFLPSIVLLIYWTTDFTKITDHCDGGEFAHPCRPCNPWLFHFHLAAWRQSFSPLPLGERGRG